MKKTIISFFESFLVSIESTLNQLLSKYVDVKKSINEKTFNIYSLVTKNMLIDSCTHFVYKCNDEKNVLIDCKNTSELKNAIDSIKKLVAQKSYYFTITFFCFIPIKNPINVLNVSIKKNLEISKHVPYVVNFYKHVDNEKTLIQNFMFKSYNDFKILPDYEKKSLLKCVHTFLQFMFINTLKCNESFYILSLQNLSEKFDPKN